MTNQDDYNQLLQAMGINPANLSDEQKEQTAGDILQTLNLRVGERVISQLDENQLKEFEHLTKGDSPDEAKFTEWLKTNVSNYAQLIEEEAQKMKQLHDNRMKRVMEL